MSVGVGGAERGSHILVCGDGPLLVRVVEVLTVHFRTPVVVLVPPDRSGWADDLARLPARVITVERPTTEALHAADAGTASAVGLLYRDGIANVRAALTVRRAHPGLRLVVRAPSAQYRELRSLLEPVSFLSESAITAPAFVAAALGEVPPTHFRLAGRTLLAARRTDVPAEAVLCGLADESGGRALPADDGHSEVVLAALEPIPVPGISSRVDADKVRPRWPWRWSRILRRSLAAVGRIGWLSLISAVAVLAVDGLVLARSTGSAWSAGIWQAVLFVAGNTAWTAGHAWPANLALISLTVVPLALVAAVTAAVVNAVINRRLAPAGPGLVESVAGHVVVVGLGELGRRVLAQLNDLGLSVVAVDRTGSAAGVELARARGVPLVVGDANREETLHLASVRTARALLTLTGDDATNLLCCLAGRRLRDGLRVVLSTQDAELAASLTGTLGEVARNPAAAAAPAFAMALTGHDQIAAVQLGATTLQVIEMSVEDRSRLHGAPLSSCSEEGSTRVVGVRARSDAAVDWSPADHRLEPGEILTVVGTTAALARLIQRGAGR
ncbi:NAD(P)-binding protein [Micromonospora sp. NPDC051141]|uniref:NAD(P)-binding protein n=1 Tax=Micromonospora sp. NPDC051141 TaxID=3364284 RepID=UPI003790E1E0